MKKHGEWSSMGVLLFLIWVILNGRITAEILLFGAAAAALTEFFACKALGYGGIASDLRFFKNLPLLIWFAADLILEIFKSSFQVMGVALRGRTPDPVLVEIESGLGSNVKNVMLANCITLTPGTVTVLQEGDHLVIHCLLPEYGEGLTESSFLKILRRMSL